MKTRLKLFISAISAAVLCSSCADLDLYPLDMGSSDTWYQTKSQIEMSIKGLYRPVFWPIDDVEWSDDTSPREKLNIVTGGTLNPESSEVSTRWQNAYKAIARANTLLEKLENAESTIGLTEEEANLFRAQTRFARAGQYGKLTAYYGDVVYVDKSITIEEAFSYGRTDKDEIMQHVYEDFDFAAKYLPLSYDGKTELATKGAAYALKARYALWNGDWDIAAEAAKACMDLNIYSLHPDFAELFLASTHHAEENIMSWPRSLELDNTLSTNEARDYCTRNRGGWVGRYPTWELFCCFLCDDGKPIDESPNFDPHNPFEHRDPRCAMTIAPFEEEHLGVVYDPNPYTTQVYNSLTNTYVENLDCKSGSQYASYSGLVRKKGIDEDWVNDNTFKVAPDIVYLRYADVLLMYAEAKIEANDIDQSVKDAINKVRARAYGCDPAETGKYPAITEDDQAKLRTIVRTERRMELAYEGWRYMDLIRWRIADQVLNTPQYGLLDLEDLKKQIDADKWFFPYTPEIDENGTANTTQLFNDGYAKKIVDRYFDASKHYLWPIPSKEVITNPNLGQNDNY